eukprot:scaffold4981_cov27-Phaeocystis_antarctica.AAC.1
MEEGGGTPGMEGAARAPVEAEDELVLLPGLDGSIYVLGEGDEPRRLTEHTVQLPRTIPLTLTLTPTQTLTHTLTLTLTLPLTCGAGAGGGAYHLRRGRRARGQQGRQTIRLRPADGPAALLAGQPQHPDPNPSPNPDPNPNP